MTMLDEAIEAIRNGDRQEGRRILEQILETEEDNEDVWLWLSSAVDADEDREICLENVLALNPDNIIAQKGLEALRSGTFNVHDLTGDAMETHEEEVSSDGITFHDQFFGADESSDDDLEWPSVMQESEPKATTEKKFGGINLRLIILAVFGVVILCGLGSAAAYNIFLAGGGEPPAGQPAQNAPGATATETPTPEPTPTPTETPFLLPTAKPTDLPTPTATKVVSPTPGGG